MKKVKTYDEETEETIQEFKEAFSRQSEEIRAQLVKDLPAYNMLIALKATSFEELSLKLVAKQTSPEAQEVSRKKSRSASKPYSSITPPCPNCTSYGRVSKDTSANRKNYYYCNACKHHFTVNHNSIVSGTKLDALTWMKMVYCLTEGYGLKRCCEYCGIAPETYYNLRHRIFYAMQVMMEQDLKLYGLVQCDCLYEHVSYKGSYLREEDTEFAYSTENVSFIPRPPRERGGSYPFPELNANSVCLFAAIDDHGHCVVRFSTIGQPDASDLHDAIPSSKYLLDIPRSDPFEFTTKKDRKTEYDGPRTLLVSDEASSIKKYAREIGIDHESHVFYRNGKYLTLPEGAHNIQRVNWLCSRLNYFFERIGYVSSKYLPGFLTLFEFMYNTGASEKAIDRLFEILVTPGLGLGTKADYAHLYTTPNYILEWGKNGQMFKNVPFKQLVAAYMRHIMKTNPDKVTYKDITEATGYQTPETINRIYENILASGAIETLCKKMSGTIKLKKEKIVVEKKMKLKNEEFYLVMYNRCCENYLLPLSEQKLLKGIEEEVATEYKKKVTQASKWRWFKIIESQGLSPYKFTELKEQNKLKIKNEHRHETQQLYLNILDKYLELEHEYIAVNNTNPKKWELYIKVGECFEKEAGTISNILRNVDNVPGYDDIVQKYEQLKEGGKQ